jgi:hypothetical protein
MPTFTGQIPSFLRRSSTRKLPREQLPDDAELPEAINAAKEATVNAFSDMVATYNRHLAGLREVLQEADEELAKM